MRHGLLHLPPLLADDAGPLWNHLDPELRVAFVAAIAGIALVGVVLILFVFWGGRIARREARRRIPPIDRGPSDWDRKRPLEEKGDADE